MPGPGAFWIGKEEFEEVIEVMNTGHLFRYGSETDPDFLRKAATLEQKFAELCSTKYALATSSGTSSLLVSLVALGLKPGDEIIVPAYTFIATYSACLFLGLVPVMAEVDESLTLDPGDIEHRITPRTKAIIPVHMLGNPCDMEKIMYIAKKHYLSVLEDACQALGASYKGVKTGAIGDIGAFSLNVFKTINCGDGGLVVTNSPQLYEHAFGMHDQGHKPLRLGVEVGKRDIMGLNFRINEVSAAIGLAQLGKLDRMHKRLREIKAKFKSLLPPSEDYSFRTLNDSEGESATICTVIFNTREKAEKVTSALGSKTVDQSGWHVYSNMENILYRLEELGYQVAKGSFPRTDDLLSRSLNISIGVVDDGLGAGWGLNINSPDSEIEEKAQQFIEACQ